MANKFFASALCLVLAPLLAAQQASEASGRLDGAAAPVPGPKPIVAPKHTKVPLILLETISSATASKGQSVRMAVAEDVRVNGVVVIAKGTSSIGIIDFVRKAEPEKKDGDVTLKPISVNFRNSKPIALRPYNGSESDALGDALLPILPICFVVTLVAIPFHRKHETGKEFVLEACSVDWSELSRAIEIDPPGATSFEPTASQPSETELNAVCPNAPQHLSIP